MQSVCRLATFLAAIAFVWIPNNGFAEPSADLLQETDARVQAIRAAQDEVTPSLMQQPEILGTAIGLDDTGKPTLKVYVHREAANAEQAIGNLPQEVRGTPVQVELMAEIRAMGNTQRQTPLISLGTSGGWAYDLSRGYCCAGTARGAGKDRHYALHFERLSRP